MVKLFESLATIDDDSGTVYVPFVDTETATVGVRVTRRELAPEFLYLNPSGGSDDGVPTVFVYRGESTNPAEATPLVHVDLSREVSTWVADAATVEARLREKAEEAPSPARKMFLYRAAATVASEFGLPE